MAIAQRLKAGFLALDRITTRVATFAACFALALSVCLACYQIFMRYVVRQSTSWSEPILQMAIIYMVYLGAAVTFRRGALVAIDLLLETARGPLKRAVNLFVFLACLVLVLHMVWYGWQMTMRAQFNVNPTLGISMSWAFLAIPLGGVFALIAVVAHYLDPPAKDIDTGI
jgi:TRAP-type C4-dicarboxylate transport system permease small subunit